MTSSALLDVAAGAPVVDPLSLTGGGGVLLLVPHPDDESLGCGLAVAALTDAGVPVQAVLITDGSRSHPRSARYPAARLAALRAAEFDRAWRHLTASQQPAPVMLGYRDCDAPGDAARRNAACDRIDELIGPATGAIWATWSGDPHVDHLRTAELAAELHARHPRLQRHAYPIWGRFAPQARVPSADRLSLVALPHLQERKARAIAAHASQMTGLIHDDPSGFVMRPDHQRHFLHHPEIFIHETRHAQ